jgi:hypothetical protein
MVPSRDCMKKAMATTHGTQRAVTASRGRRLGMGPLVSVGQEIRGDFFAGKPRSYRFNIG